MSEAVQSTGAPDVVTSLEQHIKTLGPVLKPLARFVDAEQEFALADWLMMGALALEFRPDCIIEVGRGSGSTTAMLTEIVQRLPCEVLSFESRASGWEQLEPKLREKQSEDWFSKLVLLDLSPTGFDFDRHLPPACRRILFLCSYLADEWMRVCVDRVFPILRQRDNLVIVRGVSDLRGDLVHPNPNYFSFGTLQAPLKSFSILHDWLTANRVTIQSPPLDIVTAVHRNPRRWNALRRALIGYTYPLVGAGGHWIHFGISRSSGSQ